MKTESNNSEYMIFKALKGGKSMFVSAGSDAIQTLRNQYANKDLFVSSCSYSAPDPWAQRTYPLYFWIASSDLERTRISTLEAYYYITENFGIPEAHIEVIYDGGGIADGVAGSSNRTGENNSINKNTVVMMILIPPVVFDAEPTPLMPATNYQLARQLAKNGIKNINIDVYQKNHFLPLPNSQNSATGKFVIPLQIKELLYLDSAGIAKLAQKPKPEDSATIPRRVPEAVEWFAELCIEEEKKQHKQKQLQELVLKNGWQIPTCIRRLLWVDLGRKTGLEACRVTAQYYSFINASEYEIWHHIQTWAQRNAYKDYQKLKAIITFAVENGGFVGCEHPLLQRFCPAGKCFMAELINEYENPRLFKQV